MAKAYLPKVPFNVPALHFPCTYKKANGANVPQYPDRGNMFYCSAVAWVGVRANVNDLSAEKDTLTVETWFNAGFKKDDKIQLLDDNSFWRIETIPENINRKGQWMRFKVVAIRG